MSESIYDVIIIGGGPAGASAALYAARGGLTACIIHSGVSALHKAHLVDNYYGSGSLPGGELYERGLSQTASVGVQILNDEVTHASFDGEKFTVSLKGKELFSRRLVIATGAARKSVNIDGIADCEGKGVSYCAVCDAFFYRRKTVGVIGAGSFAEHEYGVISAVAEKAYLFTNGQEPSFSAPDTDVRKITRVVKSSETDRLAGVEVGGEFIKLDGLFIAVGVMGSSELAKSMGVFTDEKGSIKVDGRGMTNIPGLYAAGDCTAGTKQVAKAVNDGMTVGLAIIDDLKKK